MKATLISFTTLFLLIPFLASPHILLDENLNPFLGEFPASIMRYFPATAEAFIPVSEALGYLLNITINLGSQGSNFDGIKFTTQQFDSLFPPMKDISPPQNVSLNLLSNIKPFSVLNFTDFHLSLDFNLGVNVLLPDASQSQLFTNFNLTGYAQLQIIPRYLSVEFRLYIKDYSINNIIIPDSETSKIDKTEAMDTFNSLGQFGIDYANHLLSQKNFMPSPSGYLVSDSSQYSFNNGFVEITMNPLL